ncbi:MAG: ROK family protein [Anaerolineae bacterium]
MEALGIDIGGSGMKAAPVDTETGALLAPRYRIETPQPATPTAMAKVARKLARHFEWTGPIGCGFPAPIRDGVALLAANVDASWIGTNVSETFAEATGCPVVTINDADAAGLAEIRFGAGRDRRGVVLIITLGTGIGSALFINGQLVPNTEFGHIEMGGKDAESYASDVVRKREDLSWKDYAKRVDEYLHVMEFLLRPELIIIGGGASKKHDKLIPRLTVDAEVVPAQLLNDAGIIGAALATTL